MEHGFCIDPTRVRAEHTPKEFLLRDPIVGRLARRHRSTDSEEAPWISPSEPGPGVEDRRGCHDRHRLRFLWTPATSWHWPLLQHLPVSVVVSHCSGSLPPASPLASQRWDGRQGHHKWKTVTEGIRPAGGGAHGRPRGRRVRPHAARRHAPVPMPGGEPKSAGSTRTTDVEPGGSRS